MSISPETVVGLPMAFTLGFAYGIGPCLVACMPALGTVFLAKEYGWRRSWQAILPLSLGRLTVYACLSALAGWAGANLRGGVAPAQLSLVVGAATLLIGIALLWPRPRSCARTKDAATTQVLSRAAPPRALLPGGLYLMGIGLGLTPCVPLGAVLVAAAASGSAGHGALLGVGFGLGAILIPSLVYGLGVAWFGERLRHQLGHLRRPIETLAAGLLILVGLSQLYRVL